MSHSSRDPLQILRAENRFPVEGDVAKHDEGGGREVEVVESETMPTGHMAFDVILDKEGNGTEAASGGEHKEPCVLFRTNEES